jgi:hypothetical protein
MLFLFSEQYLVILSMSIYYKLILFILLSFSINFSYAQDLFRTGYVKLNTGEVKKGLIQQMERSELTPYIFCYFKENDTDTTITYIATDIAEYGYNSQERFLSKKIFWEGKDQMVFLKMIEDGSYASLLFGFKRYFISKSGNQFEIISNKGEFADEKFITGLLNNCQGIELLISITSVEDESLKYLIREYNGCFESSKPGVYISKFERTVSLALFAGYDYSTLSATNSTSVLNNQTIKDLQSFQTGLNVIFTPLKNKSYSLIMGAWYNSKQFFYTSLSNEQQTSTINEFRLKYTCIQSPLMVRFNNLAKAQRFLLYGQAGILIPFSVAPEATLLTETESGNTITIDEVEVLPAFKEPLSITASIGAEINLFSKSRGFAEINYSYGSKTYAFMNDNIDLTLQTIRLSIGLRL